MGVNTHNKTCHCGQPTAWVTEIDIAHMNQSLAINYCIDCAIVRCDTYPGACK